MRCLSLRASWRLIFGSEPDLSPTGRMAMGMHVPTDEDDVRLLLYSNATNAHAVTRAAALVRLKYDLRDVIPRWRQVSPAPTRWLPERPSPPIDPDWLTVWPECGTSVKDSLVLELAAMPGSFISAEDHANPVRRVQDAHYFDSLEVTSAWMHARGMPPHAARPRWRSAALAEEDQRRAAGVGS